MLPHDLPLDEDGSDYDDGGPCPRCGEYEGHALDCPDDPDPEETRQYREEMGTI
jgi:hypothetical protein